MWRAIAAVTAGLGCWIVAVTVGNVAIRAAMPGYAEAEAALRAVEPGVATQAPMAFSLAMMSARLLLGAASSVLAGATTAWISRGSARPAWIVGLVLVVLFIPVHVWMWERFPIWYHLAFLASLLPCTLLGAGLAARSPR